MTLVRTGLSVFDVWVAARVKDERETFLGLGFPGNSIFGMCGGFDELIEFEFGECLVADCESDGGISFLDLMVF